MRRVAGQAINRLTRVIPYGVNLLTFGIWLGQAASGSASGFGLMHMNVQGCYSKFRENRKVMKRQLRILTLVASVSMAGCSLLPSGGTSATPAMTAATSGIESAKNERVAEVPADRVVVEDRGGRVEVQKVEFHSGVSSATVERLGRRYGCIGRTGAGLLTEKGPVEVYRMQCDNGTVFMARCELRQCRPMH